MTQTLTNSTSQSAHIVWQQSAVNREQREAKNGHRGAIVWFTGLSGSGKSTLANGVQAFLQQQGCQVYVLDGDNVRHGLCGDLGFSANDRQENIRRIGEVAKLFVDAGVIVLTAFISPYQVDRERVRKGIFASDFIEIYCDASVEICEARDVKGLYKKARNGEIAEFTGISSAYEVPTNPELVLNTGNLSVDNCVQQVIEQLLNRNICKRQGSACKV